MRDGNLFTMLSAFRPGSAATPFENYCTSGLAYFLGSRHRMLAALFAQAAGVHGEELAIVEVQPQLSGVGFADLVLTFEGGTRVLVEVEVEAGADQSALPPLVAAAGHWLGRPAFVLLRLRTDEVRAPWVPVAWLQVVEALEDDADPLARQFADFVMRDVLGAGPVSLDDALASNRLYALGAAAVRRHFGDGARYTNSASRPIGGHYRYLGTTFAPNGGEMTYWAGVVNETVPLGEHYHFMLASKERPLTQITEHPRSTGDWKWRYWTGLGRVVRPLTADAYDELIGRIG